MESESTRHEIPTRRDHVTCGGAVGGGGLCAGCTDKSEESPASAGRKTETRTGTETETEPTSTGETDTTYEARIEPTGCLTLEEAPETWTAVTGPWTDVAVVPGQREGVELAGWYPPAHFFDRQRVADVIDGVSSS